MEKHDKETSTDDLDSHSKQPVKILTDFDTLVISGGSSKGILTLGALQYAYDNFILKNIETYVGTSIGAIICFLLLIGYTPIEIIIYICTHQLMEKLHHFNIVAMLNGSGALSFSSIYEELEKITIDKLGYLPTFEDLHERFKKKFICVTYNLTDNKTEYISYENYPKMPCLIALRMSANLPLIFENFKYGNKFFTDGGISDNFPIAIADKKGNKVLGVVIMGDCDSFNNEPDTNIIEYIYKLMFIPMEQSMQYRIENASDKCKIIKLEYPRLKFFNFKIDSKEKLNIFSEGYNQMKKTFEDL